MSNIPERSDTAITQYVKQQLAKIVIDTVTSTNLIRAISSNNASLLLNNTQMQTTYGVGQTTVKGLSQTKSSATFGVTFKGPVDIKANSVFANCVFQSDATIKSGIVATFTSCVFHKNITNAGTAADVNLIGCLVSSGSTATSVTQTGTVVG